MENSPVPYQKSASDLLLEGLNTGSSGDEELLKVASKYSLQLSGDQMRCILFLKVIKKYCSEHDQLAIDEFIKNYLEFKEYNGSDIFVMAALREISLKKFIDKIGINVQKQM